MAPIKIPKTPASAYNPNRKASDLLKAHVWNLEKAVGKRSKPPAAAQTMTEGEAAAYIRQLSRELHQRTLLPELGQAPTIGQRPPASSTATRKARKKPRAHAARPQGRKAGGRR